MKNIQGTEENLELFNQEGVRVYAYRKCSDGYSYERTCDSNGNVLTYKNSSGYSYEYTRGSNGNIITYKDSDGFTRGFDKTYTPEEIEFIKRAVQKYWDDWNAEHPDNQNDLKLTQQILNK
jgi:YD repeat-containing protein